MGTKKGKKYVTLLLINEKAGKELGSCPGAFSKEKMPILKGLGAYLVDLPVEEKYETDKKKKEEKKDEPAYLNEAEKK